MPFLTLLKNFLTRFNFLFVILTTIIGTLCMAPIVPLSVQRSFYTASVVIRSLLVGILPLLVLPYLVCSFNDLRKNGPVMMVAILTIVVISNFLAIITAYPLGISCIPCLKIKEKFSVLQNSELTSFFECNWGTPICIEMILVIGIVIGILLTVKPLPKLEKFFQRYYAVSTFCFEKIIIPLLPFYIIGTLFKVNHDMEFAKIFAVVGKMMALILLLQTIYIGCIFLIANKGNIRNTITSIRNALPAGLLGFATMSSLVTMPVTIKSAEKNTQDPVLSNIWITTSVNSHAIGECLSLPLIALTLVYCWGIPFPGFEKYLIFAFYMTLAQFTAVSVPGGSLIVILPFLKSIFGFDTEMIGIITALSIFFDPFGTAQNVMGNSAVVMVIKRFLKR